ncbi:glycerol-3-phosphate acyltransferase 2, mitochondrial isoform X3 [Podarcis raffonei]|uniref:glycerol-3-phosphate acyltransferase 2, mitochondrial isoform X3 n=1 Tax=Podarcis raffonei TaxID=65483 RepID=UPI002329181F|nr:glycerol-3-phosphate acyltransferase 2, mitochondrial isoform X3 [Podarcis raffonei]
MWEEAADMEMKTLDLDSEWKLGTVVPFWGKCRPFVGYCCQRCTPKSWEFFFHKNMISLGFCNVIKISEGNTRFRGWLVRRLCCFFTVCDWKICADTPSDLQKRIFHSKRVQDIVCQKVPQSKGDAPETSMPVPQWMQRIHSILCQIQSSVSPLLLRLSHWVLLKLLNQMFLGVIIHKGQLEMVRRAAEVPDVPVVFLSTHKSQLDRLLLQLLLISQGLGTPRVTCEYKTCPSKCRTLLALLGGVFLPQGVEQARDSEQGVLSRAVLASSPTQTLSLWTSLWTICRAACGGLGCVRVDFAQPFSLQEYVANSLFRQSGSGKCLEELLLPEILGKRCSILDCEKLEQWSPGSKGIIALNTEQEILVYNLGLHTLSAGVSCSAIMAVQIMSALFLHKHKEGVFLSQLMQDFVWLTEEILLRSYDVGFSGQVRDVVLHALFLLRHCISLYHLSLGDVLVVPKKTDEAMTELSQHSTALLPVFIQEAVGVCAANALLVELLPFLGSPEQLRDVVLVQEELHNKTVLLVQLLPRDFLLCQPCQSLYNYCQVAVDKLIQCGLLVAEEMPSDVLVCDTAQKRFTKRLLWKATDDFADSDSDYSDETGNCCFKISQVENCSNFFVFLCCLLSPLLKTLERATVFLWEMESPQSESQFVEKLHCFLARKAKEDSSFECVCRTLTTISVRIYKELGVLREAAGQGEPILHLSKTFHAKENQEKLEKFIQQFIYS